MKQIPVFLVGALLGAVLVYPVGVWHGMDSSGSITAFGDKIQAYKGDFDQSKRVITEVAQELDISNPKEDLKSTIQELTKRNEASSQRIAASQINQLEYGLPLAECESRLGPGSVMADLREMGTPVRVLAWTLERDSGAVLAFQNDRLVQMQTVSFR